MLLIENRALLDRFRTGEKAALGEVYAHYAPAVAGFIRSGFGFESNGRRCRFHGARTQFDLEDRLHDVFGRAFSERARQNYDGLTPYKTYLFTITRNLIIDDFRKKETALLEYSLEPIESAVAPDQQGASEPLRGHAALTGDPRADAESRELARLVGEFLAGLAPREREVYKLRYLDQLEHKDIATKTGLSPSKVKTSEQRIRETFFEFMQGHGYFEGYVKKSRGFLEFLRSW